MNNKREIWIERIQDYKASSLTAAKWCEENGLNINSLRYYIHKFNKEKKEQESSQTKWTAVFPARAENNNSETKTIKITIGQAIIEVVPGFDSNTFETLIRILKEQC
ncbi:hypothetical protein GM661_18025 [Iocasia frigidifontis]|uniref:Transposase n=1 Tax=Iocasia fonsfrigidae TaxID=2682810 RepID=A0A8A7K9H5_9FIRM|nr:late promoter transcription accessory protein [Iocasia fonsfrigidae]QTL97702.1 hypothetical protein GM661_06735 [Iocasia fonsfrigidae]QTL97816.1 hypothetical protein GM661_07360 [Iocasia fonsfrigidae]QTL97870.1 hypothetical protein GM661_07665 [Iocasia fonsfrigidae]QTL99715.1 hypothetical protein GM661_18025 [Iocasia fonsfrigidae]